MTSKIENVTKKFISDKCDEKGNIKASNIDTKTKQGVKSLHDIVKKGELLVVPSDTLCNSVENYVSTVEHHVKNDPVIILEVLIERVLNGTTLQLGRILQMGEDHNHWDRTKQALNNKKCHVPVLSGMEKDHKQVEEGQQVPLRPCAGADEANNGQLSHTLAQIVAATAELVDKEVKSMCKSTDELIHGIEEEVNKQPNIKDLIIFSSDITAMFPSLDIPECAKVAADEFLNSDLVIENIEDEELGLYLAVAADKDRLEELGVSDCVHTYEGTGKHPGITTKEILDRTPSTKTLFTAPVRKPSEHESRLMFALALELMINTAMEGHMYSFNGKIRRQASGGAIGNSLTGALSALYMLFWVRKFKKKLITASAGVPDFVLYLMKLYVDDCNYCCEALPPGARLIDGKIEIVQSEVEKDKEIPKDVRTAKIILEIASSIAGFIKLTADAPSLHPSGFMPLLDVQANVVNNVCQYKFYRKPCASPLFIPAEVIYAVFSI